MAKGQTCPDCGVEPGQLHAQFCPVERCPYSGTQLASCSCIITVLELSSEEQEAVEEYVDDGVEPLKSIVQRWCEALNRKGRIPFV